MLAAVDVDYRVDQQLAVAACVLFGAWEDAEPSDATVSIIHGIAEYVPGQFYQRELPCLLQVLGELPERPTTIVVDGYVWLSAEGKAGLGAHLHQALGGGIPVIGVAKTAYAGASSARPVFRGESKRPLHVTSVGVDVDRAASQIERMHGRSRIPTLLRRVDRLARDHTVG